MTYTAPGSPEFSRTRITGSDGRLRERAPRGGRQWRWGGSSIRIWPRGAPQCPLIQRTRNSCTFVAASAAGEKGSGAPGNGHEPLTIHTAPGPEAPAAAIAGRLLPMRLHCARPAVRPMSSRHWRSRLFAPTAIGQQQSIFRPRPHNIRAIWHTCPFFILSSLVISAEYQIATGHVGTARKAAALPPRRSNRIGFGISLSMGSPHCSAGRLRNGAARRIGMPSG